MRISGLSADEIRQRKAEGLVNSVESTVSRSYKDIFVENFLNWFNLILMILGVLLFIVGDYYSALSATGIIALNILVSTIQEIRAKRRLDKIAIQMRPMVTVIRNGVDVVIDQSEIVMDDIIHLTAGDQVMVDGEILEMRSLEMDEAALTGESSTVRKHVGDTIYSGSFCITGESYFRVTALGPDTFAANMLVSARKYKRKKTPLQLETSAVTKLLITVAGVILVVYMILKFILGEFNSVVEELKAAAIVLDIVPIALFLLITLTYMIAAVRMADTGILLQRSNSVESMSHVDTVCMDKTGTITSNRLLFRNVEYKIDEKRANDLIRLFAGATGSRNRTVEVLEDRFGSDQSDLIEEIQFSSERKYSAIRAKKDDVEYVIYVGAWNVLKEHVEDQMDVSDIISSMSKQGLRTIVVCEGSGTLFNGEEPILQDGLKIVSVISIADEIRADCRETMEIFMQNNIDIKVISGDDPETVWALFDIADIPGERKLMSGDDLDNLEGQERTDAIMTTNIFGRMKPDHKELIIDTLRINNRYVAMVGDGVNDVKAIKSAQVGISLESGSGATRGAADMVLMNDRFSALPKALTEGRRTVTGMRDILKIYLTRNFALVVFILFTMLLLRSAPIQPIQNTLYALMTVSIAAFLMTLWAKPEVNKDRILPEVIRFAVPTSIMIGVFGLIIYAIFYIGTGSFINIDYHLMADSAGIDYSELAKRIDLVGTEASLESNINSINARSAMFFFMILSGILVLLMVQPLHKIFSTDDTIVKDKKPTILVVLMILLFCCIFFLPQAQHFAIKFLWTAIFPPIYYLPLIGLVIVWFFSTRAVLRSGMFSFLSDYTERWFDKKLEEEVIKSMEEDGGVQNDAVQGE
ncbi:MAG TPA: HAD-IC family P-type ATPase [Candidatus Methanomethylophilaceae archaeon]|nr:HAD-IC family P-type ATPase [Candidatus Methanomethylophilaceae archaeon]